MLSLLQDPAAPAETASSASPEAAQALSTLENHLSSMDWASAQDWTTLGKLLLFSYGPQLLTALAIFVIGRWIAKLLIAFFARVLRARSVDPTLIGFLSSVIYALALTAVVIAAIGHLGVNTTSLTAILAAGGLAVGLALQGSLGNFASGVMIILFRPFRVGDVIEGGGTSGKVKEVGVFATILTTPDNKRVIVPNGSLTSDNIVNYSAFPTRRVDMTVGVGYGDDLRAARAVIERVVMADERVLKDPAPTIAVSELGDSSVNFIVRPWVNTPDYWDVYFALTEAFKEALDEAGISIPYPHRELYVHQVPEGAGV